MRDRLSLHQTLGIYFFKRSKHASKLPDLSEDEDLEEGEEGVRGWAWEKDQGQEGRDPSVQHRRTLW